MKLHTIRHMNVMISNDSKRDPQTPRIKENDSKWKSTNDKTQGLHVTSHHRSMSADLCRCSSASVITVRKRIKEPQPPPRGASLVNNQITYHPTFKRYSCPPIGICHSLSSSSSSSSSSCSSPPPVQTSAITGRDPLGWKLRPKSSSPRSNRLSLQMPLTVPDKLPTRPKPPRRHNSDSSALLRCMAMPLPVKRVDELQQVCLRPVAHPNDYDDVFSHQKDDRNPDVIAKEAKVPPPVPYKSAMARQIAQLMTASYRHHREQEDIYSRVKKPKPASAQIKTVTK